MTLSLRALNRATLARQLLLSRSPMSALDAIEHLVGMQAQAPFAPYYGLWSRLDGFTGEELSGLLTSRRAARIVLMRGTIHLVTAKDCHGLRPLVQPVLDRMLKTNATHGRPLAAVDVSAGSRQSYVEDCQVCCKPNVLDIRWSPSDEAYLIRAELES